MFNATNGYVILYERIAFLKSKVKMALAKTLITDQAKFSDLNG